jgi:hypothetical protein
MISMIGSPGMGGARTPNPGLRISAISKLREAIHLIQEALPGLDVGDDAHKAALSATNTLSKVVGPDTGDKGQGISMATLAGLMGAAQKSNALMGMGGGGAGMAPPTPPPPMGPGGPAPMM